MPDANGRISRRCNPLARTRGERNDAITTYVPFRNRTALRFFRIVKEQTADSQGVTTARHRRRVLVIPRWALVELIGFEPTTPCLQSRCSPS